MNKENNYICWTESIPKVRIEKFYEMILCKPQNEIETACEDNPDSWELDG